MSFSSGTHLLIKPILSASLASKRFAKKIISRAIRSPTILGRYCVAPTVGQAPTLAPVCPNMDFSEPITKSHHKANS